MYIPFRLCRLLAVLGLAAAAWGCNPKPGTDPDDDDAPFAGASDVLAHLIVVTPARLEFTHHVRQDDCPQLVGRVRIRNSDTVRRTPVLTAGSHLGFRPASGPGLVNGVQVTVEPNQTIEIDLYFACDTQSPFTSEVTVTTNGSKNGSVPVQGTVG